MRRAFTWFNVCLVGIVVWLVLVVWQQHAERDAWQQKVSIAKRRASDLQIKAHAVATKPQQVDRPEATPAATTTRATSTASDAHTDAAARFMAELQQRRFRLNALNNYAAGCMALHLSPETVARVKEIILMEWKAAENARKDVRSDEEMSGAAVRFQYIRDERDAQLTALLGHDAYEQLQAYERESHFDWTIGTDMWDGGAPLSADQLHALTLATVQTKFEEGFWSTGPKPTQSPDPVTGLSVQDLALLTASSRFLSPPQQEILRQNLIDDNAYNAAMRGFAAKQRQLWEKSP